MTESKRVRNTFGKSERLASKNRIDLLFKEGISKRSGCLRMICYKSDEVVTAPVQVLFTVSKRQFHKAVERNLLKRRMREAYRLNKNKWMDSFKADTGSIFIVFLFIANRIEDFSVIEHNLVKLLLKIPSAC